MKIEDITQFYNPSFDDDYKHSSAICFPNPKFHNITPDISPVTSVGSSPINSADTTPDISPNRTNKLIAHYLGTLNSNNTIINTNKPKCPTCQGEEEKVCECPLKNSICINGHRYHRHSYGKIINGPADHINCKFWDNCQSPNMTISEITECPCHS